jgi:hypothetical protein
LGLGEVGITDISALVADEARRASNETVAASIMRTYIQAHFTRAEQVRVEALLNL